MTVYRLPCQDWLNLLDCFPRPNHAWHPFTPTTNLHPPRQPFIYLSIRVTFHFSLLFSAVFLPDPCSLLKEARDFPAACGFFFFFFLPTNIPGFPIWPAYYTYFEASYISKYLGEHQRPHFTAEARVQVGATAIGASSPPAPLLQGSCLSAAKP